MILSIDNKETINSELPTLNVPNHCHKRLKGISQTWHVTYMPLISMRTGGAFGTPRNFVIGALKYKFQNKKTHILTDITRIKCI